MTTTYFCWRCKTKEHWANEMEKCQGRVEPKVERALAEVEVAAAVQPTAKIGRPKKYPDRKTQMREYMRRRRAEVKK